MSLVGTKVVALYSSQLLWYLQEIYNYEVFGFFLIKKADNMRAEAFVVASSLIFSGDFFFGEVFLGDFSPSFTVFFCFAFLGFFAASQVDARFLELLVSFEDEFLLLDACSGFFGASSTIFRA